MNFDERKKIATELVVDFLCDFSPPRGLDSSQMASRVSHVADAFARRMPTDGDYAEKVEKVFDRVRDTHQSNSWPPQAAFIMAMPQTEYRGAAPESFKSTDPARVARLMAQGLSVPEIEIWRQHDVSRDVLDRYRHASIENWKTVYGMDALRIMREKYGDIVGQYFSEVAQ